MSARRRRSKRRSAASSGSPPEPVPLYLDRNLGNRQMAEALREAGHPVEIHDDHLPKDAPDEDWLELVGARGWIALTKDKNIRYRRSEIEAVRRHGARVIVLRAKNVSGPEQAAIVVVAWEMIQRFSAEHPPPFVAGMDRVGRLTEYPL